MQAFVIAAAQACSIKGEIKANVKSHVAMARMAAARGAGLVVFPELSVLLANHGAPSGGYLSAGRSAIWDEKGRCLAEAPSSGSALVFAIQERGRWTGETVQSNE